MTFTTDMKPASCTTCSCIIQPGEEITQYAETHGSQIRTRYHHADYAACRGALARESVRYSRIPKAAGDGKCRYESHDDDMPLWARYER